MAGSRFHLLYIEDNADDAFFAKRALERMGVGVRLTVAREGSEALDLVTGPLRHDTPDLILLDINMPGLDGLDLLDRLRARPETRIVPIVVLSASKSRKELLASYGRGANSYICKPVDQIEYQELFRRLIGYWLGLNEAPPKRSST